MKKLSKKYTHILLKCVEELNELSVELMHAVNKPGDDFRWLRINREIADVEKWVKKIKLMKHPNQNFKHKDV